MSFNLNDYENVKSRKLRFYAAHPDGRITCSIENDDIEDKAIIRAYVYLTAQDQEKNLPRGVGHALEIRDKEKQKNKYGNEYESVNYTSWVENCEESAVGRALDNAGFASNAKCSSDEIEKAGRNAKAISGASQPKAESNAQAPQLASDYIVTIGTKCKGKALKDCDKKDLANLANFLEEEAVKTGKPVNGKGREFLDNYYKFTEGTIK
jgi:hypothetical protein